jgi:hypothetical protein
MVISLRLLLRKGHAAVKQANYPAVVTVQPVRKDAAHDNKAAYDQLVAKAERLRAFEPDLTLDQAFARVYTNPVNIDFAEQERKENRPRGSTNYPFPGGKH